MKNLRLSLSGLLFWILFMQVAHAGEYTFTYQYPQPKMIDVEQGYQLIEIAGTDMSGSTGNPLLPEAVSSLLTPSNETVLDVQIILDQWSTLPGSYQIAPAAPPTPLSMAPPQPDTVPNAAIYGVDDFYPGSAISNWSIRKLHGAQIVSTFFTPVRYNPVLGIVEYQESITIKVITEATGAALLSSRGVSSDRAAILQAIDNDTALTAVPARTLPTAGQERQYLVITTSAMVSAFTELTDYRETALGGGYQTHIETVEFIEANYTGVDRAESIRNYIIESYNNYGCEYVVLGGDADGDMVDHTVPMRGAYSSASDYIEEQTPADIYYACLDGSWNSDGDEYWGEVNDGETGDLVDYDAEIAVGRIPADNAAEATTQIDKIIAFEARLITPCVLLAGEQLDDTPTWSGDQLDYVYQGMAGINADSLYDRDLAEPWGSDDIITMINSDNYSSIHHMGHANQTLGLNFYISNIQDLNNGEPLFVYTQGCNSGRIDYNDSWSENMVNSQQTSGAFAVISNSRYGWYTPGNVTSASNMFHRNFIDALFTDEIFELGAANNASKRAVNYHYDVNRWIAHALNLLGDPATKLDYVTPPECTTYTATNIEHEAASRAWSETVMEGETCWGTFCWGGTEITTWYVKDSTISLGTDGTSITTIHRLPDGSYDLGACPTPDITAPEITLNGDNPIEIFQNSAFTDPGATAMDDRDGDLSGQIVVGGNVNTAELGTYTLTYDVSDAAGNAAATMTRIINVVPEPDCTAYTATNIEHEAAGRAWSETVTEGETCWFRFCWGGTEVTTWYATGSNENLGTNGSTIISLKEEPVGSGVFVQGECQ